MSIKFAPDMGPRGAIQDFGVDQKEGSFFNREVVKEMLQFLKPYKKKGCFSPSF